MSGTPFQIPGLGHAKSNELLPSENFTPDLLAAAASIYGDDGLLLDGTNGTQWEKEQGRQEQQMIQEAAATPGQATIAESSQPERASGEAMEVDRPERQPEENNPAPTIGGQDEQVMATDSNQSEPSKGNVDAEDATMVAPDVTLASPHVAHALEAALDGLLSTTGNDNPTSQAAVNGGVSGAENGAVDGPVGEHPEWEVDSSPYESSSETDSSDSSSEDDSEDEGGYQLLGLEETARMLMAEGEGEGSGKGGKGGAGGQIRTKNEVAEEALPKPDVVITPDMKIEPLGLVEAVVEKTVVIKSKTPGEVQVLDIGSLVCRGDRTVIGVLAETLGNVRSPLYTVAFSTEDEIKELGLQVGTEVFYSVVHANYVFTQVLRQVKGSDASNLHDEEVAAEEMEFSDDEKEAEYKRQLKAKKRGNKPARGGREATGNPPHPLSNSTLPSSPNKAGASGLNYDEDEDGPYKPLARPPGFGQGLPSSLPQLPPRPENGVPHFSQQRGGHGHRDSPRGGRGDFRGGRGRGGRGRAGGGGGGRGGRGDRRQNQGGHGGQNGHGGQGSFPYEGQTSPPSNSYSSPQPPQNPHMPPPPYGASPAPIPPRPTAQWAPPIPPPYAPAPIPYAHGQGPAQPQPPAAPSFNFNYQAWNQSQPHAYPYAQQPHVPQPQQPTAPTYGVAPPSWASVASPPPPTGAYVNPAFFGGIPHGQVPQGQATPQQAHQPPQQQYWGQPHGGYGQGSK